MVTNWFKDTFSKKVKQLQTELEQSHRFLYSILNHIPDLIFVKDEDHRYVLLNDAFCSAVSSPREELIGKSDADIHSKDETDLFWENDKLVIETGRSHIVEEYYVNAKGEQRAVLTTKSLFKDSTGEKYVVGIAHDITEHKKAEDAFRDEVRRRQILVEQSRDGIVVIGNDGRLVEANQKFADMLGYSLNDLFNLHVWDWDGKYTKEELLEMTGNVNETGDQFLTRFRRIDGRIIDVDISTNGAIFGEEKFIFCVCRDITERKHAAEERERLIRELKSALTEVKTLRGILPICASCKKIRDDTGYWNQIESYIGKYSDAEFSHGICPDCAKKLYGDLYEKVERNRDGS